MIKTLPLNTRAKTTVLKQPKEIFSFARDIDNEYLFEKEVIQKENLPYFYLPDSYIDNQIDLGGGYSKFKKIPDEENLGDFGALLKALIKFEKDQNNGEKVQSDIITFRGLMTKLLALPYNLNDPIDFNLVTYDGQIFMKSDEEIELQRRKQQELELNSDTKKSDYVKRCEFSGYKFETIATLPKPWADCSRSTIEKRNKKLVNNYEQYISVVRTGIGKVKLLLAGEVDGLWDYIPTDNKDILPHYVELKTSKVVDTPGQVVNFEKKLFKTWAQSFLLGIRKVVYGFRDDNLILRNVEIYQTEEIPLLIKENPLTENNKQNKVNCMSALKWYGAVVEWITNEVPRDSNAAYRLSYDPGSRTFSLRELLSDKTKELLDGGIITPEFKAWRENKSS